MKLIPKPKQGTSPLSPEQWDQVRATAAATGSLAEAARLHGLSAPCVRMRASREKWNTPRRVLAKVKQAKAEAVTVCMPVAIVTPTATEAIERHMAEHKDTFRTKAAVAVSKAATAAADLPPDLALAASQTLGHLVTAGCRLHGIGGSDAPTVQVAVLNQW